MFELPQGKPVSDDENLDIDKISFPFEYGLISYFKSRAKSPCGHRFVCAGKAIGWLADGGKRKEFIGGEIAKSRLLQIAHENKLSAKATEWTISQFKAVAEHFVFAFTETDGLATILPPPGHVEKLAARNLSMLTKELASRPMVNGAISFEEGILINSAGKLPVDAKKLAKDAQEQLNSISLFADSIKQNGAERATMWMEDGILLLTKAGNASLGLWTEFNADHHAILSNALSLLEMIPSSNQENLVELPKGFTMKESKGGVDSLIEMMRGAREDEITGYISSIKKDSISTIVLIDGNPCGVKDSGSKKVGEIAKNLTEPKRELKLCRLDKMETIEAMSGTIESFSISELVENISNCRTKNEKRQDTLRNKMKNIFGFEIELEQMNKNRSSWKINEEGPKIEANLKPVGRDEAILMPADLGSIDMTNNLRKENEDLARQLARMERRLNEATSARETARKEANNSRNRIDEMQDLISELNISLDKSKSELRTHSDSESAATNRSDKLSRRVKELEHQLEQRLDELAQAIGDAKSSSELRSAVKTLMEQEIKLKTELSSGDERLKNIRDMLDSDERRQRLLSEQVQSMRDRHRKNVAELELLEQRITSQRDELGELESEAHASRRLLEQEREMRLQNEHRVSYLQNELKELMDERRKLLRELGDIGARKAQVERDLSTLIESSEELQEEHERALADISEASKIRARLQAEPLAQALLDHDHSFKALGPVMERLEHAKDLGFTVTLLDRAVERGLAVIHQTVEDVAKAPRYLLSQEVMELLERQAPETASTVRGLTRWNVQQKLDSHLGETVQLVVMDLEHLLEDFERSIMMLRELRKVLDQLGEMGAPKHKVRELTSLCNRPEALPNISKQVRRLIQNALDELYLDADKRDTGGAVLLQQTATMLQSLIEHLDNTGLTDEIPMGSIWEFRESGILPFESIKLSPSERAPVPADILSEMNPIFSFENVGEKKIITEEYQQDKEIIANKLSKYDASVLTDDDDGTIKDTIDEKGLDELSQLEKDLEDLKL